MIDNRMFSQYSQFTLHGRDFSFFDDLLTQQRIDDEIVYQQITDILIHHQIPNEAKKVKDQFKQDIRDTIQQKLNKFGKEVRIRKIRIPRKFKENIRLNIAEMGISYSSIYPDHVGLSKDLNEIYIHKVQRLLALV